MQVRVLLQIYIQANFKETNKEKEITKILNAMNSSMAQFSLNTCNTVTVHDRSLISR